MKHEKITPCYTSKQVDPVVDGDNDASEYNVTVWYVRRS